MKRVLFITRTFGARPGGMQTHAREIVEGLRQIPEIRLTVVAHRGGRFTLPLFACRAFAAALFHSYGTIHVADASLTFLFPILQFFRPQQRRTCTIHGLDILWPFPFYKETVGWCLGFSHNIAAVSTATRDASVELGIEPSRIVVVPCGIRIPERVPDQKRRQTLLSLGRLIPRKGILWFLEHVFSRLDPTLRYVIAGDGPERKKIQSLILSLGLQDRVQLLGEISEERKEEFLQTSALLVVPNIPIRGDMEGFGIVCIEAASRGLPVVAARLEGLQDAVIEGVTGNFFESLDAASAKEVISEALRRVWDTSRMVESCRERFSLETIASSYVHHVF